MTKTLTATFDGQVLRPDSGVDLEPNRRYLITIQEVVPGDEAGDVWQILEALAGIVSAPPDWSVEHDHYLYGTPRHSPENSA